MAKSVKLKNDTYLDSKAITHNRELLSDIVNQYKAFPIYESRAIDTDRANFNNIIDILPTGITSALIVSQVYSCAVAGAPKGAYNWGVLLSFKISPGFNRFYDLQIYIPDNIEGTYGLYIRTRIKNYWKYIAVDKLIDVY